jgi:transcriptional regulator with XRE-family HTH domain
LPSQKKELSTFHQRLTYIREQLGLNKSAFARKIEISAQMITILERGITKPGFDFFIGIVKNTNINIDFLLLGEGPPFRIKNKLNKVKLKGNKEVQELLDEFVQYFHGSEYANYKILKVIDNLLDTHGKVFRDDLIVTQLAKKK